MNSNQQNPKFLILKSDMADGRHVGKYIFGYNSTMVFPICAKLWMKTQNPSAMTPKISNFY